MSMIGEMIINFEKEVCFVVFIDLLQVINKKDYIKGQFGLIVGKVFQDLFVIEVLSFLNMCFFVIVGDVICGM